MVLARLRGMAVRATTIPCPLWSTSSRSRKGSSPAQPQAPGGARLDGRQHDRRGGQRRRDYQFLPAAGPAHARAAGARRASRKTSRNPACSAASPTGIKKTADSYLNQKLDEIEARIDRKLDEIDRRLAEWRDKEIANRIRILKITLWASVIVGVFSLIYSYVKVYFKPHH